MDYLDWNNVISEYFFNEKKAGQEVILYVDDNLINKLGENYGSDVNDFIESVKEGPYWAASQGDICAKANYALGRSKIGIYRNNHPFYIAYLAFFVLAVDTECDFIDSAYYPRLNIRLGDPERRNAPPGFHLIEQLWFDLQEWSIDIKKEKLGRFTIKPLGPWRHVGLPLSQTILTTEERGQLPAFFSKYNFDPTSLPSYETLSKAICDSSFFKKRTKRLVSNYDPDYQHLKRTLLDTILNALKEWDGTALDFDGNEDQEYGWVNAFLRLCIEIDRLAMIAKITARFKSKFEYPEDEFQFIRKKDGSIWTSKESIQNWSRPISEYYSKKPTSASLLDWNEGEVFTDEEQRWRIKLKPSLVRLFIPAKSVGLNGWVEVNTLEQSNEYLIACHESYRGNIMDWGKTSCEGFSILAVEGLPHSWCLFEAKKVIKPHSTIDVLKFPSSISMNLEGGIKSGRGNVYFKAAPPKIRVEGVEGNVIIKLDDNTINKCDRNLWVIPEESDVNTPLKFELFLEETCISTRTIILEEPSINSNLNAPYRDRFGVINSEADKGFAISGVYTIGSMEEIPAYKEQLPTYLSYRIIYLGRQVGQIAEWPKDTIYFDWEAVWAVAKMKRDKWKAFFVGKDISKSQIGISNRKNPQWKKWKRVFTHLNVEPPHIKKLNQLWMDYKKEASNI